MEVQTAQFYFGMLGKSSTMRPSSANHCVCVNFIIFLYFRTPKEVASIDQAHDSIVWALAWHPLGHILCSGSNDHSCKFWTRNYPGDPMRDKYNLNTIPQSILGFEEYEDGILLLKIYRRSKSRKK